MCRWTNSRLLRTEGDRTSKSGLKVKNRIRGRKGGRTLGKVIVKCPQKRAGQAGHPTLTTGLVFKAVSLLMGRHDGAREEEPLGRVTRKAQIGEEGERQESQTEWTEGLDRWLQSPERESQNLLHKGLRRRWEK